MRGSDPPDWAVCGGGEGEKVSGRGDGGGADGRLQRRKLQVAGSVLGDGEVGGGEGHGNPTLEDFKAIFGRGSGGGSGGG